VSWRYLPYALTLGAPLVVAAPGTDPNSAATLGYIPGSAVRGAVARALGSAIPGQAGWEEFHRLILGGTVRYLNAYPLVGGDRGLPSPIPWRRHKSGGADVINLLGFGGRPSPDHSAAQGWSEQAIGRAVGQFVSLRASLEVGHPSVSGHHHHQRDRSKGRAWTDPVTEETHGTLFGYESLDARQSFGGLVMLQSEADSVQEQVDRLKGLLRGQVILGRSRRAGYGGDGSFDWHELRDREMVDHSREMLVSSGLAKDESFTVVLTSPYAGRDPQTGQPDPTCLVDELQRVFLRQGIDVEPLARAWAFAPAGGYNRTRGLPLPQRACATAGSCVVLKASSNVTMEVVRALEANGLGERQMEGFGRFLLFKVWRETFRIQVSGRTRTLPAALEGEGTETARSIERRIAEDLVGRRIESAASTKVSRASGLPTPSLLGRLRVPLRAGLPGLSILRAWLSPGSDASLRRPALDQLERCRFGDSQTLKRWLEAVVTGSLEVGSELELASIAERAHVVSADGLLAWLQRDEQLGRFRVRLADETLAALERRYKLPAPGPQAASGGPDA
jgi:CRISPR-associated protein Csx10